jgi:hypothetical protein
LETAVNIIAAPLEALATIRLKPTVLLPWAVIIIANTAVVFSYYSQVDLAWVLESSLEAALEDMGPRQRQAVADRMENLSLMDVAPAAAVAGAVILTVWLFLNSAYLAGVSLVTNDEFRRKQWFAMLCWCALPVVLGHLASVANIFLSDATFLRPDRMNPLSFSSLLNLESALGNSLRQMLQSMDLTAVWSMGLTVFAYHAWTKKDLFKSALIVLAPATLLFGSIFYFTSS